MFQIIWIFINLNIFNINSVMILHYLFRVALSAWLRQSSKISLDTFMRFKYLYYASNFLHLQIMNKEEKSGHKYRFS